MRTRNGKFYPTGVFALNDKGEQVEQLRAVLTQRDQHYHDGHSWQDIDANWVNEVGFGRKVKKARHNLRVYNNKLKIGFDKGVTVEYTLPVTPRLAEDFVGNKLSLANAWSNTDLEYFATPEGVKSDIVLKQQGHPSNFSFPVNPTNCVPVQEGNIVVFYKDGSPVGRINPPYMIDANGEIGQVILSLVGSNVVLTPDSAFLANAIYPVKVDPTTTIQPDAAAGIDTMTYENTVTTNYGTSTFQRVGMLYSAGQWSYRVYDKFDISGISGTINSANLSKYIYQLAGGWDSTWTIQVHYPSANWGEDTLTWSNQPTPTLYKDVGTLVATGWKSIDIKELIQDYVNGTRVNNGWIIKANKSTGGVSVYCSMYSSDYTDPTLRPKLEVTYTPAATGSNSPFGNMNKLGRRLIA